jgi:hypothetical protein
MVPWLDFKAYQKALKANPLAVNGWMAVEHLSILRTITNLQLSRCIVGSVGEIGVHHGRFFIPMALASHPSEPKIAMDVFENQERNIDHSGYGDMQELMVNMKKFNVDKSNMKIIQVDSSQLSPASFKQYNIPMFRLLSVDGAHFYNASLNDLRLAAQVVRKGGVIIVDDFINVGWVGVAEATFDFLKGSTFGPFLWACNKLYLTTKAEHATFLNSVRMSQAVRCSASDSHVHPSRYTLRGFEMCVHKGPCSDYTS